MTTTAIRRTTTRGLLVLAVLTAPLATTALAAADPVPLTQGPAVTAPSGQFVDADDWHWWHCHIQREYWREGCRDWWEDHHDRDDNLPPTGSGM
ncbi:hypothetical protein [Nocardia sp. CDC160]|uniref:hypothetical protein n=1 Tax=Nocardia sp. CDC160 TaxID=3112166 RepID=UPI002DC03AA6|nr:hypothetical protein [Nocardia sp. CDC160]MEC3915307.1 hypothetical protein [Nocardia sp. CDC160]